MKQKKHRYYIGIDPGVKTGIAIWDSKSQSFDAVGSTTIHEAISLIQEHANKDVFIRVEDARKRKWFGGKVSKGSLMGAGSIKRDCKIWEDFLTDLGVDFEMIHPIKGATKLNADAFARTTKWKFVTNEHGRDAAMLVFKK